MFIMQKVYALTIFLYVEQGVYAKFSPPPDWHFYSAHPTFKTFSPSPPPDWKATPLFFYSQNPTPPVAQNAPPLPLVFAATVPRAAIAQFCWGTIMSRSQEVKVGGGEGMVVCGTRRGKISWQRTSIYSPEFREVRLFKCVRQHRLGWILPCRIADIPVYVALSGTHPQHPFFLIFWRITSFFFYNWGAPPPDVLSKPWYKLDTFV